MTRPTGNSIAELFKALAPALVLYARQWTGPVGAEDVVQEVFVRMLAASNQPAEPKTWLFRCVRNAAISAGRSTRRRGKREESIAAESPEWFVAKHDDRIDAKAAQAAMSELPIEQREILTLRIWSQMTLAEISAITGVPISTVHDSYKTALASLRARMSR
jgi:RNA polymerase sigma-70 factor (ECF subfamily)